MVNLMKPLILAVVFIACLAPLSQADDLNRILQTGTLRHLGIPYANFITSEHVGLDVGLMKAFANYLGVEYLFVESSWKNIVTDLTGKKVKVHGDDITITGTGTKRGDIISTGFTVLPWRKKIVLFSEQTFPSGIWLVARNDSALTPIKPTGNINDDIARVKEELAGVSVLGLKGSCLAPSLYGIDKAGADIKFFPPDQDLDGMIPSIIAKNADSALVDVPVALIALAKWPGKIKVIGPVSAPQKMSCAFAQDSPQLKKAFDAFFADFIKNGSYRKLVEEYYPSVFTYYPDFLAIR
jgi:ABC-type amino acid transport substrate-binding protein